MANLSKSEAKRLIEGKAVEINRSLISDNQPAITIKAGDIIKIGKRKFINIV
jgi:tyrosyl-tRNA synthetase